MTLLVEFEVIGIPIPQGSKKAFVANGRAMMKESSAGHAAWRNAVAEAARRVCVRDELGHAIARPLDGALELSIDFRFPMPKSRPKRMRLAGSAWKTTAPDTSKLVRCIEDALQAGGLVVDDARFVVIHASKFEVASGWTGAAIRITREELA